MPQRHLAIASIKEALDVSLESFTSRFCYKCGKPTSIEVAIQTKEAIDTEINNTTKVMVEYAQDPKLWKEFLEFKEFQKSKQPK